MISSRCYYALQAVLEMAGHERGELLTIGEIARARRIPARFLEAILLQLKQNGIARSFRGKSGGYTLARPSHNITVGEVIRIFDPDVLSLTPAGTTRGSRRKVADYDVFADLWKQGEQCLANIFSGCTFHDLITREQRMRAEMALDFVI